MNGNFFKSNWIYLIWCGIYFLFTWLFIGSGSTGVIGFISALLIYGISNLIALSPFGEAILRLINDIRTLDTRKEREYLMPIFEEVYSEAKKLDQNLRQIKLYIIDTMNLNACAIGFTTVAVTQGAIKTLTEDELKGIIAHEIGHIAKGHTIALLLTVIGNGIFTLIMVLSQIVANMITAFMVDLEDNMLMRLMMSVSKNMFNLSYIMLIYLIQAILAINSRKNEFEADYFAYEIGYGENLLESLYILQENSMNRRLSVRDKLLSSHPHIAKRIGRLEAIIDREQTGVIPVIPVQRLLTEK